MIIAIVPSPGHEALVAAGDREPNHPAVRVERPMTIGRCKCGAYACRSHYLDGHGHSDGPVALVLHAPGDPKLGMLRALDAAFGADAEGAVVRWDGEHEGWLADRDGDTLCDWPVVRPPTGTPVLALPAFALAHLLVQCGPGAEVVVIKEPADKAKE